MQFFPAGRMPRIARWAASIALLVALCSAGGSVGARADVASWIVIDAETGAVLEQKDARRQWYPASITKLMTAYLTFKAIRDGRATLESAVAISVNARAQPPSKMGFKPGTQMTLDSALKMLIVKSANDIAVAVAETVGGSEPAFIEMMNAEARRLGMSATRFVNPHGLPDNRQVSSARDLAVLGRTLWREFPQYRSYFGLSAIRVGKKTLRSANREFLARVRGANGMKTGYICNSGLNVVVSATRGGRTVMAVILGSASGVERAAKARKLIDDGFRQRSGRNIDALTGVAGGPPADGYCKRNPRPEAEELMATFAGPQLRPSSALSFAQGDLASGGVRRPIVMQTPTVVADGDDDDVPTRTDGKTDWGKVMDEIIGPRQRGIEAVQVSLGIPKGRTGTAAAVAAIANAPLPRDKPMAASASLLPASGVAAEAAEAVQPLPGAIFRGKPLLIAPLPPPNPRP